VAVDEQAEYISIAEASTLLGVHRNTVRNRIKVGRYKAHKVVTPQGETYAIERESLGLPPTSTLPNSHAPGVTTTVHHNGEAPPQPAALISVAQQAQADAVVQRLLAPFIAELGAVREELGHVKAERDGQVELLADLRRRTEAAETEAAALRLRLAEVSVPPVVVVAGQDATEGVRATATTSSAQGRVRGLWRRVRDWAQRGVVGESP